MLGSGGQAVWRDGGRGDRGRWEGRKDDTLIRAQGAWRRSKLLGKDTHTHTPSHTHRHCRMSSGVHTLSPPPSHTLIQPYPHTVAHTHSQSPPQTHTPRLTPIPRRKHTLVTHSGTHSPTHPPTGSLTHSQVLTLALSRAHAPQDP